MIGNTTGKEMFQIDEYNTKMKVLATCILINSLMFVMWYVFGSTYPTKMLVISGLIFIGLSFLGYFNYKHIRILRRKLY